MQVEYPYVAGDPVRFIKSPVDPAKCGPPAPSTLPGRVASGGGWCVDGGGWTRQRE